MPNNNKHDILSTWKLEEWSDFVQWYHQGITEELRVLTMRTSHSQNTFKQKPFWMLTIISNKPVSN